MATKNGNGNNKGLSTAIEKHVRGTSNFGDTKEAALNALGEHLDRQKYSPEVRNLVIINSNEILNIREHRQNRKPGYKLTLRKDFRQTISSLVLPHNEGDPANIP